MLNWGNDSTTQLTKSNFFSTVRREKVYICYKIPKKTSWAMGDISISISTNISISIRKWKNPNFLQRTDENDFRQQFANEKLEVKCFSCNLLLDQVTDGPINNT